MPTLSEGVRIQMRQMLVEHLSRNEHDAALVGIYSCEMCPFDAAVRLEYGDEYNWYDPAEQYYDCPLKQRPVWGEDPVCGGDLVRMLINDERPDRETPYTRSDPPPDTGAA